jgi:hypothetical protein
MAETSNGYPFPTGTDLAREGDNAIQALAEATQSRDLLTMHGNPIAQSFSSGTLGYVAALTVAAVTFDRIGIFLWRGLVTTQTAANAEFNLRETSAANAIRGIARSGGVNQNPTGIWVGAIPRDTAPSFDVTITSGSSISVTGDARFAGLDILLFPAGG